MKRMLRYAAIAVVCTMALSAGAFLILRRLYPPERIKSMALERLRPALGRDIRIGSIGLSLEGVDLRGLEISEAPDFNAGTFLKAQALSVRPRFLPLLSRQIEVSAVTLKNWECRIVKQRDGSFNFSSLGKAAPAAETTPSREKKERGAAAQAQSKAAPAAWSVANLQTRNGSVLYEDKSTRDSLQLTQINASVRDARPLGEFPISLKLDYSGRSNGQRIQGRMDFQGNADLGGMKPEKLSLRFDPLDVQYGTLKLSARGNLKNSAAPKIELYISVPKQAPEAWKTLSVPAGISIPALDAHVQAEQNREILRVGELNVNAGASTVSGNIRLPPISLKASGEARGAAVFIRSFALEMGGLRLNASGSLSFPKSGEPVVDATVKTNRFDLADSAGLIPQAKTWGIKGQAEFQVQAKGPLPAPALNGTADLTDFGATYAGQTLSGFNGQVRFSPKTISSQLKGKLNRGDLSLNLTAADYQTAPNLSLNGSLSELDLTPFMRSQTQPSAESGAAQTRSAPAEPTSAKKPGGRPTKVSEPVRSSGKFVVGKIIHPNFNASQTTLAWNLNQLQSMERLTGSTELKVGPGQFDNLKSLGEGNPLIHTALLPVIILQKVGGLFKIPLLPSFDKVRFRDITGTYAFQDGLMTIKESRMNSDAANVTASGAADLRRDQLNLHISTKLGSQLGLNVAGPIGFTVRGSMKSPSVRPDVASILKQPAVNKALEQGEQLLRGLFNH